MGLSYRLADAPPALAALHREHLERQTRLRASAIIAKLPPPSPGPAAPPAPQPLPRGFLIRKEYSDLWSAYAALILQIYQMSYWWSRKPHLSTADVLRAVCAEYEVQPVDVSSDRRTAAIVRPRHVYCFLCQRLTLASLPRIGRRIRRDHTSVLHGIRSISALAFGPQPDHALRAELIAIAASLGHTL